MIQLFSTSQCPAPLSIVPVYYVQFYASVLCQSVSCTIVDRDDDYLLANFDRSFLHYVSNADVLCSIQWLMTPYVHHCLGKFPERLAEYESELNLGRGIYLPTTPWESVWSPISEWLGVDDEAQLDEILPNRKNFPSETIFSKDQLFGDGAA